MAPEEQDPKSSGLYTHILKHTERGGQTDRNRETQSQRNRNRDMEIEIERQRGRQTITVNESSYCLLGVLRGSGLTQHHELVLPRPL